jgi:hypothetical protein
MAPAVDPAMTDRRALGFFFFSTSCDVDAIVFDSVGYRKGLVLMGNFFYWGKRGGRGVKWMCDFVTLQPMSLNH